MSRVNWLLQRAGAAISGLMQARWRTGDTSESSSDWEMLRLLALRAGDNTGAFGSLFEASLQARAARAVGIGIAFDAWTDAQLARFPAALASHNALEVTRRGLEAELELPREGFKQRPEEVRAFFGGNRPMPPRGFNSFIRHLSSNVMGDQQIQDNLAVIAADYEFALAQLDVQNRLYVPPPTGERSPAVEIVADQSPFSNYYFMPFKDLVAWNERRANFRWWSAGLRRPQPSFDTDTARFAAALELERRSSGGYPDSLDAVGAAFPSGMPHDVATGGPYFYERTPEGSYRIWSTGIDQTNNNGDPKKDIVFTLPKVE